MPSESKIENPILHPFLFGYQVFQTLSDKILSPAPPNPNKPLGRPNVAIIGAGITGVTSAAHCVGHGFDVTIFEAGPEDKLGGIWSVSKGSLVDIFEWKWLTNLSCTNTESQQYFKPTNPLHDVSLPPICQMGAWVSR